MWYNGALHLFDPTAPRGLRLPIDFFFRSLAEDRQEQSIGVVLSGMGSDGTLGIKAIKERAGLVMAQDPATTDLASDLHYPELLEDAREVLRTLVPVEKSPRAAKGPGKQPEGRNEPGAGPGSR